MLTPLFDAYFQGNYCNAWSSLPQHPSYTQEDPSQVWAVITQRDGGIPVLQQNCCGDVPQGTCVMSVWRGRINWAVVIMAKGLIRNHV